MKVLMAKTRTQSRQSGKRQPGHDQLSKRVNALYKLVADVYGLDKLVLRAGKLNALKLLRSDRVEDKVLALQKVIMEDPTLEAVPVIDDIPAIMEQLENEVADLIARRAVEEDIEKKVNEKLQQKHEDYVREVRLQVVKENTGPENAQTLKKLALLEKLEQRKLSRSAMEMLRPAKLEEIVGQERPVRSLMSKIASPYPQHVILYGPPGVGKTTTARLALAAAREMRGSPFLKDAPFVEVNGSTLRWDSREATNPLLGSVHDPIYQGARRDLAESGIPEPKPGLVTDAHGGVLFIDEIGDMDPVLHSKLLKVLEDKRVFFDSSYYDPHDANVPQYIKKIFDEGLPADFILIGATTRYPDEISPAIRSRCAEIYFEPLTPEDITAIVRQAAVKLGVDMDEKIPEIISEYTIEGRKAVNILSDAFGLACQRGQANNTKICREDAYEVIQAGRLTPYVSIRASDRSEPGKVFGMGVNGFLGSLLEIEAVVFPAREKGKGGLRFNDTAGSMTKDSVFNAASVIRKTTGEDLFNYDVHINVVGGGRIDGPSAGAAIFLALYSAVRNRPIPQDTAVTGELSIQGMVRAVGGIPEKIYGARQSGVKRVVLPVENAKDVPGGLKNIDIIPVETVEELIDKVFNR